MAKDVEFSRTSSINSPFCSKISKYINLIIYIIYHRVKHKKSVFMRVCKLLHLPTGENGHLPTGENEEKASFAYGGK